MLVVLLLKRHGIHSALSNGALAKEHMGFKKYREQSQSRAIEEFRTYSLRPNIGFYFG